MRVFLLALLAGLVISMQASASVVRSGFDASFLSANDDGSTGAVSIGFDVNFFGLTFSNAYLNNNGNLTFDSPLSTFTPFNLTTTGRQIIAPFFADVDTRGAGSGLLRYGAGTVDGRDAFGVTWVDVGYYSGGTDKLNSFQVILIERGDTGTGNFDIEFNYDKIQWETGNASGGSGGLGGNSARVGFSNGTGSPGTFFEFAGSAINRAFLDANLATGLIHNSTSGQPLGRYRFEARDGEINEGGGDAVPEPATIAIWTFVCAIGLVIGRQRFQR